MTTMAPLLHPVSRRRQDRRQLILAGLILFPLSAAQAAAPSANQANVNLETDISTMAVQVGQGAPLPPGGCNPGYAWHTTYGGCRIAQKQSESAQCPNGQAGTRSRDRTAFILQADPANVVYEDWGDWKDECRIAGPARSNPCKYEPGRTELVFFRLPGGDPVTVMRWNDTYIVNRAVRSYGDIPGARSSWGYLCGRQYYRAGALISSHEGANDISVYELCRVRSGMLPHHSNGQAAKNGCATSITTPLP